MTNQVPKTLLKITTERLFQVLPADCIKVLFEHTWLPQIKYIGNIFDNIQNDSSYFSSLVDFCSKFPQFIQRCENQERKCGYSYDGHVWIFKNTNGDVMSNSEDGLYYVSIREEFDNIIIQQEMIDFFLARDIPLISLEIKKY